MHWDLRVSINVTDSHMEIVSVEISSSKLIQYSFIYLPFSKFSGSSVISVSPRFRIVRLDREVRAVKVK